MRLLPNKKYAVSYIIVEKENIWTFDGKGELLLTIMSSLAQEESRSISENCTWGKRKRFQDGKVTVPFGRFLGYDKGKDGNLVLNEEEAKIVRKIYGYFLQGRSPYAISKKLTSEGIPTSGGKKVWSVSTIRSILTNEKYKGDALLQKVYTEDFLTKKKVKNDGQIPQYYVENNHEAIIEPGMFDRVQKLMAVRKPGRNKLSSTTPFSSKIKCGDCGSWYGSKVWHSNDKYRRIIWQCNHKYDGDSKCKTPHLTEEEIKEHFMKAINLLLIEKDTLIEDFAEIKDTVFDTELLKQQQRELQTELNVVADMIENCIKENAHVAQNQEEYQKRYDELAQRFDDIQNRLSRVKEEIAEKQAHKEKVEQFLSELEKLDVVTKFTEDLWFSMIDYVTVFSKEGIRFTFQNGREIRP